MSRPRIKLTAAQQRALAWAARLTEGIVVRSQACAYTATMRLEDHGLVAVVERDFRGDPYRATITAEGRQLVADLGLLDPDRTAR